MTRLVELETRKVEAESMAKTIEARKVEVKLMAKTNATRVAEQVPARMAEGKKKAAKMNASQVNEQVSARMARVAEEQPKAVMVAEAAQKTIRSGATFF